MGLRYCLFFLVGTGDVLQDNVSGALYITMHGLAQSWLNHVTFSATDLNQRLFVCVTCAQPPAPHNDETQSYVLYAVPHRFSSRPHLVSTHDMPSDTATIESKLATLPELVDTETVTKTETIEADTENGLMDDVADNVPTGSTDSTNLILNAAELPTNLPDSLTNSPAAEHSGQEKVELATEVSAQNLLQNSTKTDSNDEPLKDLTDTGTVHSDLPEPQESLEVLEKVVEEKQDALPQFSDDEIEVSSQLSSDSDSDSDSDSESASDSDSVSDSGSESDSNSATKKENPVLDVDDEDEEAAGGPIYSKNEVIEEKPLLLPEDYTIPEGAPLEYVGEINGVVDKSVIIKANTSGEYRVLNEESVLCLEDKTLIGPLFEVFGRLQAPLYRVQLESSEKAISFRDHIGAKVYYVVPDAKFLLTDTIKHIKGTDASNCHDEELPVEEQEFSDDEQELASKQAKKKKRKPKKEQEQPNAKKHQPQGFQLYGYPTAEKTSQSPQVNYGSPYGASYGQALPINPNNPQQTPQQNTPQLNQTSQFQSTPQFPQNVLLPQTPLFPQNALFSQNAQLTQTLQFAHQAQLPSQPPYNGQGFQQYPYPYNQHANPYGTPINQLPNKPLVGQLLHPVAPQQMGYVPSQYQNPYGQLQPNYGQQMNIQSQPTAMSHPQYSPNPQFQQPQQQANPAQLQQLQQLLLNQLQQNQNQQSPPYQP